MVVRDTRSCIEYDMSSRRPSLLSQMTKSREAVICARLALERANLIRSGISTSVHPKQAFGLYHVYGGDKSAGTTSRAAR